MTEPTSRDVFSRIVALELRGRHPRQIQIRAAYLDGLGSLDGARVLDVGCGTGVVTRELARRVGPSGSVLGVDPSPYFLALAEERAREDGLTNCRFAPGDGAVAALGRINRAGTLFGAVTYYSAIARRA